MRPSGPRAPPASAPTPRLTKPGRPREPLGPPVERLPLRPQTPRSQPPLWLRRRPGTPRRERPPPSQGPTHPPTNLHPSRRLLRLLRPATRRPVPPGRPRRRQRPLAPSSELPQTPTRLPRTIPLADPRLSTPIRRRRPLCARRRVCAVSPRSRVPRRAGQRRRVCVLVRDAPSQAPGQFRIPRLRPSRRRRLCPLSPRAALQTPGQARPTSPTAARAPLGEALRCETAPNPPGRLSS